MEFRECRSGLLPQFLLQNEVEADRGRDAARLSAEGAMDNLGGFLGQICFGGHVLVPLEGGRVVITYPSPLTHPCYVFDVAETYL